MQYNVHPIIVHFPIALLFLYSAIKVIPFKRWMPSARWHDIQLFLLLFGVLGAVAGLITGNIAETLTRPNHALAEMHAFFASLSAWIYGALLGGELIRIFNQKSIFSAPAVSTVRKILTFLEVILTHRGVSVALAVFGFFGIALTGLLGGAMVYGTSADPFAETVLRLFHLTI